jgi:hypothetical protein
MPPHKALKGPIEEPPVLVTPEEMEAARVRLEKIRARERAREARRKPTKDERELAELNARVHARVQAQLAELRLLERARDDLYKALLRIVTATVEGETFDDPEPPPLRK